MPTWTRPPLPGRWSRPAQPGFTGRARELAVIEDAWEAVSAGARHVVFLGGEPGAGKSRLLREACTALHAHGATVLLGTCVADLGPPYQPFVEPLDALQRLLAQDHPAGDGQHASSDVVRLIGTLIGQRSPATTADGESQRLAYEAALSGLSRLMTHGPLVLALEDLHLAGTASLQLLTYLVERSSEQPMLLLATHRTTPADRSDLLVNVIAQLYRHDGVRRIELSGLDADDITGFLVREARLSAKSARAPAAILRDQTGGNPFFLRELWRDLVARGGLAALQRGGFRAPESVRDTLASRLSSLRPRDRQVLELCAVVGDAFDVATVQAAAAASVDAVFASLDEALSLGLIEPAADGGGFRFLHSLVRQAVLDLMIPSRLVQAHADVARSIEAEASRAGGAPTARQVQRLAHHYASAAALGHAERACRYLVQAAQGADQALAHQDAAALFEQAASLADPPRRDELRLRAANSHMLGASWARARELDELVATTGDPRQRLQAAIGYETAGWQTGRPGERAVELLSDAMTGVENDTRDPQYVRALAGLSRALAFSGEDDHGLNDTAIEYARALGDGELLADVLETSLGYGLLPRTAAQKQARATELYELAGRGATLRHRSPAAYNLGVIAYLSGDRDGLLRAHADLTRAARLTGQPLWSYAYRAMSYAQQFASGDLAAAQRTCDELLELGQTFGPDDTEGPYGVHSYMIRRETGAVEQVRRLISGREDVGNHWAPGLLALYTELGLAGPARRVLSWLLDQSPSPYEDTAVWPGVLAFCAEAATALEDRDAARRIRPRLAEYSGHNLVLGAFDALFGSADRYLASLDALLAQGCPSESYAAALEMDTRMGATLHQAHTLAQWATYERYAGRVATAADLADRAASLAQPRGLVRVLRALPAGGTAGRPDALTAREQQVLGLLAQGLGNRAIAERLVISENTAANHVRSILVKTGSANRTQAALYGRELHGQ